MLTSVTATADDDVTPPRRGPRMRLLAGALAVGAIVFASLAAPSLLRETTKPPPEVRVAASPPTALATSSASPPGNAPEATSDDPAPAASTGAVSSLAEIPGSDGKLVGRTSPSRPHATAPPRAVAAVPAPTASAAPKVAEPLKKSCDPPFTLSSDGVKTYKPECF